MSNDRRHHLGAQGEALAAEHLQRLGYVILSRNHRTRHGELDIVAFDGTTLAFCEVKARRHGPHATGHPLEAVDRDKQRRVRRMAAGWLGEQRDRPWARVLRFDAIGVTFDLSGRLVSIEHLEGVF